MATAKPLDFGVINEWAIPIGIAHFQNEWKCKLEVCGGHNGTILTRNTHVRLFK